MESRDGWKADAEYYKNKYNEASAERNVLKKQLWRMEIVEDFLLEQNNHLRAVIEGVSKPSDQNA